MYRNNVLREDRKMMMRNIVYAMMMSVCLLWQASALSFLLGVENIPDTYFPALSARLGHKVRVGLIAHTSSKATCGKHTADILEKKGARISYLFAPEHGFDVDLASEKGVPNSTDKKRNIPIVGLCVASGGHKHISDNILSDIDVLVFDMQDAGMRHFTYVHTLFMVMKRMEKYNNKKFLVLDRPNPLGGYMEGPLADEKYTSYLVASAPIPLRHGMTVGELAHYFNTYVFKKPIDLEVIPMKNYNRTHGFARSFVGPLSPGLKEEKACYGYSFLGMLGEVRPFNFKQGNDKKYQFIGILRERVRHKDWWNQLARVLAKYKISHTKYAYKGPETGRMFDGVELQFNHAQFSSFGLFLDLAKLAKPHLKDFSFSKQFDVMIGTDLVRKYIEGSIYKETLLQRVKKDLEKFYNKAQHIFLYTPHPKVLLF